MSAAPGSSRRRSGRSPPRLGASTGCTRATTWTSTRCPDRRVEARGAREDGRPPLSRSTGPHVSAEGPDLVEAMRIVGLQSPASRGIPVASTPHPGEGRRRRGRHRGGRRGHGKGERRADALLAPDRLHFTVDAAGPDASVPGSWFGVRGVPPRAFKLSGQVRREGGRFPSTASRLAWDQPALSVTGIVGAPPRFVGTDLALRAKGRISPGCRSWRTCAFHRGHSRSAASSFERRTASRSVADLGSRAR